MVGSPPVSLPSLALILFLTRKLGVKTTTAMEKDIQAYYIRYANLLQSFDEDNVHQTKRATRPLSTEV